MLDDFDSDIWIDYIMHREKITIYDDKLLFRDTGVVFTLIGDILSMITDYYFNKTDSSDAKHIIRFWMKCILINMQKVKVLEIKTS